MNSLIKGYIMNIYSKVRNIILGTIFMGLPVLAQTPVPSPVSLQVGVGIGSVSPKGDFNGSTIDYFSGTNYGQSGGIDYQIKARVGIIGFNLVGQMDYASLSNSGNATPGQSGSSVDISQKILSLKIGPEFKLSIPLSPVTPYIGANISFNHFSGNVSFQGVTSIATGQYDIKSDSRVGYGISGGVIVNLMGLTLDVGAQYNILNAFGKKFEVVDPTKVKRLDSYLYLNDEQDPLYQSGDPTHFIGNSRTLSTFAITATIMFGL
jgi:opacity protein-like surface antigen